jgi:hypothetical protein
MRKRENTKRRDRERKQRVLTVSPTKRVSKFLESIALSAHSSILSSTSKKKGSDSLPLLLIFTYRLPLVNGEPNISHTFLCIFFFL